MDYHRNIVPDTFFQTVSQGRDSSRQQNKGEISIKILSTFHKAASWNDAYPKITLQNHTKQAPVKNRPFYVSFRIYEVS